MRTFSGGTPSKSSPDFWNGDIPWVSPKDFRDFYIRDAEDHISEEGMEAAGLNLVPKNSILVVVRSGILKHTLPVAVTTREVTINQDVKALIPVMNINAEYLALYLSVYGSKLLPIITKHSTTVQSINTGEFELLDIPLPNLPIQEFLVLEMREARRTWNYKLSLADAFLNGTDDYLLDALGLTTSTQGKREIFAVRLKQLRDKRWDVKAYSIGESPLQGKYQNEPIGSLVRRVQRRTPEGAIHEEDFITLSLNGTINPKRIMQWRELDGGSLFKAQMFEGRRGQLVFSKIDLRNGAIAVINRDRIAVTAEFPVYDVADNLIQAEFLVLLLRLKIFRDWVNNLSAGHSGRKRVNPDQFESFEIPLPPLSVQQTIIAEVQRRHEEALRLRKEAAEEWEAAKARFEQKLLGGEASV